jgi:predicted nucleotidyltransferase
MPTFASFAKDASTKGLRFLLIGGHAVAHHHYPRTTEDTDLLICTDDREAWLQLAEVCGLKLFHDGGNFLQFTPPEPTGWRLDLMLVNVATFAKMVDASEVGTLEGQAVKLPSLDHLLALKFHALKNAHGIRVLKDMDDVANLITNNRIDVSSTNFRELVLKYGTPELYEKLSELCDE